MERSKRPTALSATPALPPQPRVELVGDRVTAVLPTGESVEVFLYGATILSWRGGNGEERLWLSEAAVLDGTKAVRGGVPIVFPVFGVAPDTAAGKLPQHGLARTSRWNFLGKSTSEAASARADSFAAAASSSAASKNLSASGVQLDFGLSAAALDPALRALWPYDFGLLYSVTLEPGSLTTNIVVTNDGDRAFDFQVLLHTYLRVRDIAQVQVAGLAGAPYLDKTEGFAPKQEAANGVVTIAAETDRLYSPAAGAAATVTVSEGQGEGTEPKPRFVITRDNLPDVVVWNPWTAKAQAMADFAPDTGFRQMLCVEPGAVAGWTTLEPGEAYEGAQSIQVQD